MSLQKHLSLKSEFKICQNIFVFDIEKSVERALDTLERGADSLRFTIEDDTIDMEAKKL
jgi:methylmalonyl-CoA mutase